MQQCPQPLVDRTNIRIHQPQPCHRTNIGRHHICYNEKETEKLFPVKVRPPHQPCQRESDRGTQNHCRKSGNKSVAQRNQIQRIREKTLQNIKGENTVRKNCPYEDKNHWQKLEEQQKINNQQDHDPFDVKNPQLFRVHQKGKQHHIDHHDDADQHHGTAVTDDQPTAMRPPPARSSGMLSAVILWNGLSF